MHSSWQAWPVPGLTWVKEPEFMASSDLFYSVQLIFGCRKRQLIEARYQLNSEEPWLLGKRLAHCATSGVAAGPAGTRRVCFSPDLHFGWSKPLNSECIQLSARWLGLFIFIFLKLLLLISSKMSSLELRDTCDCWEEGGSCDYAVSREGLTSFWCCFSENRVKKDHSLLRVGTKSWGLDWGGGCGLNCHRLVKCFH